MCKDIFKGILKYIVQCVQTYICKNIVVGNEKQSKITIYIYMYIYCISCIYLDMFGYILICFLVSSPGILCTSCDFADFNLSGGCFPIFYDFLIKVTYIYTCFNRIQFNLIIDN